MSLWLRTVALIVIVGTLVCGLAAGIGRVWGRADDRRALEFDRCGVQPCFLGIAPGTTEWATAAQALTAYAPSEMSDKRVIFRLDPPASVETYISVNGHSVGRIYVSFPPHAPLNAAWVIQRYGVPCGVTVYYGLNMLTLRYPDLLANVQLEGGRFEPQSPVTTIRLADPNFIFESQPDPCFDNITSRETLNTGWHGFATVAVYLRR